MSRRRGARPWVEAGVFAAIAALILVDSGGYPKALPGGGPGPAFFPRLLGVMLLGCAAALVLRPLREAAGRKTDPKTTRRRTGRALLGMLWVAAFLAGAPFIPRLVALPLLVGGLMALAGERSPLLLAAVPLVFTALVEVGFVTLLGVPLP